MSRAVMQQALEALEWTWGGEPIGTMERDAITALRAALAECPHGADGACKECYEGEPEQAPVAWMQEMPVSGNEERSVRMTTVKVVADGWDNPIPLYTAPTPREPLTDEEIKAVIQSIDPDEQYLPKALRQFARAVEAAHGIKEQEHE